MPCRPSQVLVRGSIDYGARIKDWVPKLMAPDAPPLGSDGGTSGDGRRELTRTSLSVVVAAEGLHVG